MRQTLVLVVALCATSVIVAAQNAAAAEGKKDGLDLPPFLQGAPKETIEAFKKLFDGTATKTDKEINLQVESWVEKQTPEIKVRFYTQTHNEYPLKSGY